ncbi:soluble calcium-activated nucleotidase 1 [Nilaparvata lugens]|uniref:soluble calcium-activated nucleotidase 1 n=1 Tax=Nilaparvata lugens TaxID=108931 RepID=UPI00193CF42A|nr:soluble calcium-activated nucleotidase 1 [Nilaparvata lugens]
MSSRDWRKALRSPPAYRVGNRTFKIQTQYVTMIAIVGVIVIILLYTSVSSRSAETLVTYGLNNEMSRDAHIKYSSCVNNVIYNSTYPLTLPAPTLHGIKYRIGIISDMDKLSKSPDEPYTWISHYRKGYLTWNRSMTPAISIFWDEGPPKILKTKYSEKGRGMELSELIVFNGKLLSFDDRTGIVYEIDDDGKSIPWVILIDGNGHTDKGFKSEWATVKDGWLYVGGMGKEWTTASGQFVNTHPMWVKRISPLGFIEHEDWHNRYIQLRALVDVHFPGYMIHESGVWSPIHKKWFFLPRRMSKEKYDENIDERMATNIMIIADENFTNFEVKHIGHVIPTHGFSSFKFIPGSNDQAIVALKSEEDQGKIATYIMAFTIQGEILYPETKISDSMKFEGIEFV